MAITAALVKELRERTGAGMMACRDALRETEGDEEKAIEIIQKKGLSKVAKKAGAIAGDGLVHLDVSTLQDHLGKLVTQIELAADGPVAPQKRPAANGRSAETHSTTVLSRSAARSLKVRTLVAHVGVSMLGKMFSTTFWPA